MAGGSLRKYLHKQEPYSLPHNLILKFSLDVARGMNYLHSEGIIHRDLKSENILVGEDLSVKVADFGISCLESQSGSGKGFTSTYRWMAPEMIKGKSHTRKVDVYSFGIVLWELLTALIPFDDMTPEQAAYAVAHKVWVYSYLPWNHLSFASWPNLSRVRKFKIQSYGGLFLIMLRQLIWDGSNGILPWLLGIRFRDLFLYDLLPCLLILQYHFKRKKKEKGEIRMCV